MIKSVVAVAAAGIVLGAFGGAMPRRGAPVFADGFDVPGTFAENWSVSGKAKSETGAMSVDAVGTVVQATPRRKIPLEVIVEGSVAYAEEGTGDGWAGLKFDGYLFLLSPSGSSWLNLTQTRVTAGDNGRRVAIPGYRTGERVKLSVVRRRTGGTLTYAFFANGLAAGEFTAPIPKADGDAGYAPPAFVAYNRRTTLDDFGVFAIRDESASPNLIANSSAEYDREGLPCALCRCGNYDFEFGPLEGYERDYLPGFGVDRNVAHSGRQSMFLKAYRHVPNPGFQCHNAGTLKDAAGVFSVWMKASVPGVTVSLFYAGRSAKVKITTEWARYEVANPKLGGKGIYSPVGGGIVSKESPDGEFTVWFDDFQAEIVDLPEGGFRPGVSYASPYRPADIDRTRYGQKERIVRTRIEVPELPAGTVPTADLDVWRDKAAEAGPFMNGPRKAKLATKVYLACDTANLYVGYRCLGEPAADLEAPLIGVKDPSKATAADARDRIELYRHNSVETFLSPTQKPQWFQLMATANGQQTDFWRDGLEWSGKWTLRTRKTGEGVDFLLTIPAEDFASPELKDTWFANFCRNDAGNNESSCIFPVLVGEVKFRDMRRWAELAFPHRVAEAWRRVKGSTASAKGAGASEKVVGRLNFYMDEPEAVWRVIGADGAVSVARKPLAEIPEGTNVVSFSANGKSYSDTVVKLPYREDAVQINRFARCLERHGRKILPIAHAMPCLDWYWITSGYVSALTTMYAEIGGFRHLSLNANSRNFETYLYPHADAYWRVCDKYGISNITAVRYLDVAQPGLTPSQVAARRATNAVTRAKLERSGVIASIVIDEPELSLKSEECYRYLLSQRPHYAYRPMMMNNTYMGIPNDYARLETDVLMIDDYLTNDEARTVDSALANVDAAVAKGVETSKPTFAYLVSQNYPLHSREPTYGEQIAQCYGALADGVSGIVFWGLMAPQTAGNWRAIKQLVREFAALEDRVLAEEPPAAVSCSAERAKLRFLPAVRDGALTLVACNIDQEALGEVRFTLPAPYAGAAQAEVLFENRTVEIRDGVLADRFAGHERHVYAVKAR